MRGWLFDLYTQGDRMILWFITEEGARLRLADAFTLSFFIAGRDGHTDQERRKLVAFIERLEGFRWAGMTTRLDFWTDKPREVIEIQVTILDTYLTNLRRLAREHPGWLYFNCDIPPEIHYCYERRIFPTARCEFESAAGELVQCRTLDDPLDTDYEPPPLRTIRLAAEGAIAGQRPRLRALRVTDDDGRTQSWDEGGPAEILDSFSRFLRAADPDLVLTRGGDSVLMPALFALAQRCRIPLSLDREPGIERRIQLDGRTYLSYGRVLYQNPDYPLYGRWHIDQGNSFWAGDSPGSEMAGLLEVARLARIPVQRIARRSIGTGISSIQLDLAYRDGYLIPWKKSQPEAWKTVSTLLKADRGGLVYQPLTGVYENVIELDFASMYPSIMAKFNVSPETIDCACCPPSADVPELGYTICQRRRGLVGRAIGPLIEKRSAYKRGMRDPAVDPVRQQLYGGRQGAIKWLLVCCFGYLGYRNARFGRIEAHESTCAFSREKLLTAREVCEARGFRVLHAIVDSVWCHRSGEVSDDEIESLCHAIDEATGLKLAIEGRYRWVVFLPSRQNPGMPVPNRFFGCFADGSLKCRGIELRRSDQAPFVKEFQRRILARLSGADNLAGCRAVRSELVEMVREVTDSLRSREAPREELLLQRKTSMDAGAYRNNSMTALAARQAERSGLRLHAGQAVHFLVLDAKNRDPEARVRLVQFLQPEDAYDPVFYIDQLHRAAATVLEPLLGESLTSLLGGGAVSVTPAQASALDQPDLFEWTEAL